MILKMYEENNVDNSMVWINNILKLVWSRCLFWKGATSIFMYNLWLFVNLVMWSILLATPASKTNEFDITFVFVLALFYISDIILTTCMVYSHLVIYIYKKKDKRLWRMITLCGYTLLASMLLYMCFSVIIVHIFQSSMSPLTLYFFVGVNGIMSCVLLGIFWIPIILLFGCYIFCFCPEDMEDMDETEYMLWF